MDKNMNLYDLLLEHYGHKVEIVAYDSIDDPMCVTLEDIDTGEIIIETLYMTK